MAKEKILVVDDEEDILEMVKYNLSREGYQVDAVTTGEAAVAKAHKIQPHLIILDLMLPGLDGFEVCKLLKNDPKTSHIAIVMLTAKGEDSDIVAGLELGAEDYITKPFSPRVLIARVRAILRRGKKDERKEKQLINIQGLMIDPSRHLVTVHGKPVEVTATEFNILLFLSSHSGWVYTRNQIISSVKGDDYPVTDRSIDVQIVGLRKKLGEVGKQIETVRGVGYRFKEE